MSAALDRQIRPIYDAIDTGSNKSAIVACNKLLKKNPQNELVKALKALALVRSQKVEESLVLCDEVLAAKPSNDSVLSAMTHVLRALGRHSDMVTMFEEAYKQQPANEELAAQTFFANVRAGNWKSAQQVATKMHKQFQEDRYLYWSVISAILQANDNGTTPDMRTLLYKLAHRLVTSSPTPAYVNADRFHLHLSILRELRLFDEAHKLLDSDIGKSICATNLSCNEIRRDIWRLRGLLKDEGERAEQRIVQHNDRNWLEFLSVIDGTFSYFSSEDSAESSDSVKTQCAEHLTKTTELFTRLAEEDGRKDRSALLALIELEKRARHHGVSTDALRMVSLMQQYFDNVGDKACCFEDLKPYYGLDGEDLTKWIAYLEAIPLSVTTVHDLQRLINSFKLLRYNLSNSELTVDSELSRVSVYMQHYSEGLNLGANLPATELQPADDLAILAANALVNVWRLSQDEKYLYSVAALLEFALTKSKQAFQARLILIRIYRLLGAPSLALEHYRIMQVKQIQLDTLSHLVLSRASMFSLAAIGDLTLATECVESSQIYVSNAQETGDFVVRAFTTEKYSQIPEFIIFEDRLDNSLQRDIVKMEHLRIRLAHEAISADIIDMELLELKFIFDRTHHDNRDFEILVDYQPRNGQSLNQQTLLFDKVEGLSWLQMYLRLYIRAFQQASDIDDTVEEKMLIGDRPRQSLGPEARASMKARLLQISDAEFAELTTDELAFVKYATALAEWLEPYHNHARPPAAVLLAEAAKQTEPRPRGTEPSSKNGNGMHVNGGSKKEDEPPAVKEPPEIVSRFFDDMRARFKEVKDKPSPTAALHVATLMQEALILFVIETLRFKAPSVVKVHKLGALVQIFKSLRTNAFSAVRETSAALVTQSELLGGAEQRKTFVDACEDTMPKIDHDFALGVAKSMTDARKKVVEGVGKGMARLCTTLAH